MRLIIIDDENKARATLENFINLYNKGIEIVAQASSVETAYQAITTYNPQLILLDINMPDGSGFDLLKKFNTINFKVIFITAYEEYAIKAFKFSALDYILKPVNPTELFVALDKAQLQIDNELNNVKFSTLFNNIKTNTKADKKIILKTQESIHLVDIKEIIHCEADGGYTTIYLIDGKKIVVSKLLKEFEDMLSGFDFIRPHNSHLVNLNHIQSFEKRDGGFILMKNKSEIPVSTRRKDELLNMFENL